MPLGIDWEVRAGAGARCPYFVAVSNRFFSSWARWMT